MNFIFGNIAAQLYLLMVFGAAMAAGNHWALAAVIIAEGLTALGYQVQLLENQTPLALGMMTLATVVTSWLAGLAAGLFLVI